ncbi:MAG: SemiSWEET transporter [Chitinispirillaceae bacterium]|jgi:MtN3 and saliva related transmembrane protein|nr:SemiSWEET transporter [Chitinispirillaceae bacterium]
MQSIDIIGYASAVLTTSSFVPQVIRAIQTKSARDLSAMMIVLMTTGILGWLSYGIMIHALPIILANCISLILTLMLLACKIVYSKKQ